MGSKVTILLMSVFLSATAYSSEAEKQNKVYRVGVLMLNRLERPHIKALRDGLEQAGYVQGKNLLLNMEQSKNIEEFRSAAKMFVQEKFDVIVANSNIESLGHYGIHDCVLDRRADRPRADGVDRYLSLLGTADCKVSGRFQRFRKLHDMVSV